MQQHYVVMVETELTPAILFTCKADDREHARQQAEERYEEGVVLDVLYTH